MAKATRKLAGRSEKRKPPPHAFKSGNPYAWKPGQSGNPGGSSKAQREAADYIADQVRRRLPELIRSTLNQVIGHIDDATDAEIELVQRGLASGIRKGNPQLAIEFLARAAGKVKDQIELGGIEGGAPIEIGVIMLPPEED